LWRADECVHLREEVRYTVADVKNYVKLDIPAKAEFMSLGRLALSGLLRAQDGYSEDTVADLKLALTETCAGLLLHESDPQDCRLQLEFVAEPDHVTLLVRDGHGPSAADRHAEFNGLVQRALAEQGMGLSIIWAAVDGFSARKLSGGGTELVLSKNCDH